MSQLLNCWWLETGYCGNIDTAKQIGKCHKSTFTTPRTCLSTHHQNYANFLKLFRPSVLKLLERCVGSLYCVEFTAQIQLFLFTNEKYVDSDSFIKIKIFIVHKKMNHCGHKVCGQQIFITLLTMFLHLNLFKLASSFYFFRYVFWNKTGI